MNYDKRRVTNVEVESDSIHAIKLLHQGVPHFHECYNLINAIVDEIDKKARDFLQGDTTMKKHIHIVAWNDVCQPKCARGLGLRKAMNSNTINMMKTCWRMMTKDNGLWIKVLKTKNRCDNDNIPLFKKKNDLSNLCQCLTITWE